MDGKNFPPERGAKVFPPTVKRIWPLAALGANFQRLASQLAPLPGQGLRLPAGSRSPGLGGGLRWKLDAGKFAPRSRKTLLVSQLFLFFPLQLPRRAFVPV